ncbi:MAG: cytochrome c [Bacteroidetes bacterium]|nr:MAG: cytochrome c [Bacteroidota bacterium]
MTKYLIKKIKAKRNMVIKVSTLFIIILLSYSASSQTSDWIAPPESINLINPLKGDEKALVKGKKIYYQICATCHGRTGIGDGPGGKTFDPKPADHTSDKVQKQSDGELFWKITNGRGDMPTYGQLLSKKQRWQVIEYMRLLKKN